MAEKQSNRERLQEITARIEQGVKDVFTSDKYADYLRVMSRFHSYSTNNRLLIFMQNPHASMVCGYQGWQTKFGRHVVKGAKGIQILAPTPYKKKIEEEKRDPDTNLPLRDKDGKIRTEEVEIQIPMFRPVTVFDVADTDGKPLPVLVEPLSGDVEQFEMFFEAIRRASPVPIILEPMERSKDGFFSLRHQNIHLRDNMSQVQTLCAVFHEITHAKLHNTVVQEERKSRQQEEWEAESVAYSVCAFYGIDTSANSFGYLAEYAQEKSLEELKAGLDLIGKTADEIITAVDAQYAALVQEKEAGIEQRFHENPRDSVAIFQLGEDAPVELRYRGYDSLSSPPDKAHYKAVYTEDLPTSGSTAAILEDLFFRYNEDRPPDFAGHSLSVGDILALKRGDVVSYHYCDSFGFRELPDFSKDNTPIKKENARPSVLEQLRKPKQQPKKTKTKPKETSL